MCAPTWPRMARIGAGVGAAVARCPTATVIEPTQLLGCAPAALAGCASDWVDINEEPIFLSPFCLSLGSAIGNRPRGALAMFADPSQPDRVRGGIAWYERGALRELEQVGRAAVAWRQGQPLGRLRVSDVKAQLFSFGRRFAGIQSAMSICSNEPMPHVRDREAVVERACANCSIPKPPALPELAQALERGGRAKLSV